MAESDTVTLITNGDDLLVEAKDEQLKDDLDEEFNLEIIEDEPVNKFKHMLKNRRKLVFLVAVAILLVLGIVAATIIVVPTVLVLYIPVPPTPAYELPGDVKCSAEYQIALDPKPDWINREGMLTKWINSMNNFANGTWDLRKEDAVESVYDGHHMSIYKCHTDARLRIRDYKTGPKTGQVTVDIKKDGDSYKDVSNLPYWPAEIYKNVSSEKLEKDVHPCFGKYSRESRLYLTGIPDLYRCGDVGKLFSGVLYKCPEDELNKKITNQTHNYYWHLQWSGSMFDTTQYQITFEIQYFQSLNKAIAGGTQIYAGEWSIRIFAVDGTTFDKQAVDFTDKLFYTLLREYGQTPKQVECANRFLGGERNQYMGLGKFA